MKVLVLNCGSSSIKYQLFDMPDSRVLAKGQVQRIGESLSKASQTTNGNEIVIEEPIQNHEHGLRIVQNMLTDDEKGPLQSMSEIGACGHRVVHGGESFTGSVIIDDALEQAITGYFDLAPLHNPPNLAGIRAAKKMMGETPQIACFDTAFHQTIPPVAFLYALPYKMYEQFKIRKYGFHGISHRYVARRAAELLGKGKYDVNLITCHLGNGSSITAVKQGKSVDTSMGLTPLEGLVMGTRTGDLDAAVVLFLNRKGYKTAELDDMFNKKSGLLGISGISNDVRDLEKHAENGHGRAKLALDIFAYKIKKYIGLYLAVLNGCDAIIFTGGIGENGTKMRQRILENLDGLGIRLDNSKNSATAGIEGEIQAKDSKIKIMVIPTNEEAAIAKDTYLLATGKN